MGTAHTGLPSIAVVEMVAEREEVEPLDLDTPLGAVIDVDALDALVTFENRNASNQRGFLRFTYYGYTVTVRFDGQVRLEN